MIKLLNILCIWLILLVVTMPISFAVSIKEVSIRGTHEINGLLDDNDFALFSVEVSDPVEAQSMTAEVFDKQYFFDQCLGTTCTLKLPKKIRQGGSYSYAVKIKNKEGVVDIYQAKLVVDEEDPEITSYAFTKQGDMINVNYEVKDHACSTCSTCSGLGKITFSVKGNEIKEIPLGILDCTKKDTISVSLTELGIAEDSKLCMQVYDNVGKVSSSKCSDVYTDATVPSLAEEGIKLLYNGKEITTIPNVAMKARLVATILDDQLVVDSVTADISSLNQIKAKEYQQKKGSCTKKEQGFECVWDLIISSISSGSKNVFITAKDLAGNELQYTHTFDLIVDTMPPKVVKVYTNENDVFKEAELDKIYLTEGKNKLFVVLEDDSGFSNKEVYVDASSLGGKQQQVETCTKLENNQWQCEVTVDASGNKKGLISIASKTKDDLGNVLSQPYTIEAIVDNKKPVFVGVEKSHDCPTQQEGLTLTVQVKDDNPVGYKLDISSISSQQNVTGSCDFQEVEIDLDTYEGRNVCTIEIPDLFSYPVKSNLPLTIIDAAENTLQKPISVSICQSDETTQPNFVSVKQSSASKVDRRTLSFVSVPTKVPLTITTSGGASIVEKQITCSNADESIFLDTSSSQNLALIKLSQQSLDSKAPGVKGDSLEITCKLNSKLRRGNKLLSNVEEDEFKVKIPLFNQPLGSIDKAVQDKIDATQKRIDELQDHIDGWGTFNKIFDGWSKVSESLGATNEAWQLGKATYYAFSCPAEMTASEACVSFATATEACIAGLGTTECTAEAAATFGIAAAECVPRLTAAQTVAAKALGEIGVQANLAVAGLGGDGTKAAAAAVHMEAAVSGHGIIANVCHTPAASMMTACTAWATNDAAWMTECEVASKEHNFVDEYIWPMGLYGGNPIGTINKGAIMIFNKCALADFNQLVDIGTSLGLSSESSVYVNEKSIPSKINFWNKAKVTTATGFAEFSGTAYLSDPFRSKDTALYTGCLPAIMYNFEKEKQINCMKKTCLQNHAKQGLPTNTCDELYDLRMCAYVDPPFTWDFDFLANFVESLPYVAAGLAWKLGCGDYLYKSYECKIPGVCPDSHNVFCGVSGIAIMIPELLQLTEKLINLKKINEDMIGIDYCT